MTVVVGFIGPDGAVMASDSEATESEHSRYEVEKIWQCGGLLMGYTGATSVRQPLVALCRQMIESQHGQSAEIDRQDALNTLRPTASKVLASVYEFHVGARDADGIPVPLKGVLLVIGRDRDGYWMLEIDWMPHCTFYTQPGFHSVGTGAAAAYVARSLMRDYESAERPVAGLQLIAYRTVQTCIDTIGGRAGVGGRVQLWSSQSGSPFNKANQQEIESLDNGVMAWRTAERESLDQVLRGGAAKPDGVPMPGRPAGL